LWRGPKISGFGRPTAQVQGIGLDRVSSVNLNAVQKIFWKEHIKIVNCTRIKTSKMAVRVGSIAVKAAAGTI
jgi:hypothetical protein